MGKHVWHFVRSGGFDQVQLTTGADLMALGELDQKLWVALACPVKGLELDARTLALIDTDDDSRVRARELIAAIHWTGRMLRDPELLARPGDEIALADIDDSTDEGKLLRDTAQAILRSIGKSDAATISVDDTRDALAAFQKQPFNGDSIVPVEAADDPELRGVLGDVLACIAPALDARGAPGVSRAKVVEFFEAVTEHVGWLDQGSRPEIRALGPDTDEAWIAYAAVKPKIDDWFSRARVAAYDPRAIAAVNREEREYLAIAAKDMGMSADEVAHLPLAKVEPDALLPLEVGINPAWSDRMASFRAKVAGPLLGDRRVLTEADWRSIRAKLAARDAWAGAKKGGVVEKLGEDRTRRLAADGWKEKAEALVARDEAAEPMAKAIESVERLVRFRRDLMTLANNFVAFRDFYAQTGKAAFQAGTLYLDQRACELCIRVTDPPKHVTMAPLSKSYLLYCDLRDSNGDTMQIVAAITAGDVDNLMVGRNGLFYDRHGRDWDATITRIVDNPISVRQAFFSPYKKLLRFVEEHVAARAGAAEAHSHGKLTDAAKLAGVGAPPGSPAPAPGTPASIPGLAANKPIDVGVVAALGVAVGGITAALGALLQTFFGLGIWMPLGLVALVLVISGPSMAIAWVKLRERNLGPLLDANGWAVNAQARINVPLGARLTSVAKLPEGARRDLTDPFAERPFPWWIVALLVLLGVAGLTWWYGWADHWLPANVRRTHVAAEVGASE